MAYGIDFTAVFRVLAGDCASFMGKLDRNSLSINLGSGSKLAHRLGIAHSHLICDPILELRHCIAVDGFRRIAPNMESLFVRTGSDSNQRRGTVESYSENFCERSESEHRKSQHEAHRREVMHVCDARVRENDCGEGMQVGVVLV